ncbi:MAG: cytochrome c1 [Betaproteobacteria bacterium]|nr:cytochrome c1 [Betaproteobacteria bacterium]MCH9849402.1 cytochrome c1 [Betaproteobacteria bacterium]MDG1096966.1 cytochrome c1 [Methylophilaceae bacterium]MDG1454463.1 cytochrome c1 [Methylophilaceae bacterium]
MKKLLVIIALLPIIAFANTAAVTESAPIDPSNQASLQRGARTFINSCLNCHSANYMRYNRLVDIGLTEKEIKENLLFAGDKVGDPMRIAMDPQDAKKWFGVTPPDLSVEVRARGVDWLYAYMRGFYKDETTPSGWNNIVFDKVAMPHVFYQQQGEQILNHETHELELVKPGRLNPAEYDAFVADLTNYMAFMAEPAKAQRKSLGIWVLLFLGVLLVLTKKVKAAYWKDIK